MMCTQYQMILRNAIALNNMSVSFFQRGSCQDAIDTMQLACEMIKIIVASPSFDNNEKNHKTEPSSSNTKNTNVLTVSNEVIQRMDTEYKLRIQRLLDCDKTCNTMGTTKYHVRVIVLNDHETLHPFFSYIHDKNINVSNQLVYYPIRLEYSNMDGINLEVLLSIQLYNFAMIHFGSFITTTTTTAATMTLQQNDDQMIATELIRHSYSVFIQCDAIYSVNNNNSNWNYHRRNETMKKKYLQMYHIVLHGVIQILYYQRYYDDVDPMTEDDENACCDEYTDYHNRFTMVTKQIQMLQQIKTSQSAASA
jgi:hypothetical protein